MVSRLPSACVVLQVSHVPTYPNKLVVSYVLTNVLQVSSRHFFVPLSEYTLGPVQFCLNVTPGETAKAGATLIASIPTIRATTVNIITMRLIEATSFLEGGTRQPRRLANATTVAILG